MQAGDGASCVVNGDQERTVTSARRAPATAVYIGPACQSNRTQSRGCTSLTRCGVSDG